MGFIIIKENIKPTSWCYILINLLVILILISFQYAMANLNDCYYQRLSVAGHSIQLVVVNPKKYKIINVGANQINKNAATVRQFARKYRALVAINGGFFREVQNYLYVPAGALKVNNIWQGVAHHPRGSIGWNANSDIVIIDRLTTKTSINLGNTNLPISHFNPKFVPNSYKIVIYSNFYPDFSKLLRDNNNNFLIKPQSIPYYICNINPNLLSTTFSPEDLANITINIEIYPQIDVNTKNLWEKLDFITSGSPILIKDNQVISDYSTEKLSKNFIYHPSPRTAIGITSDKIWKLVKTDKITIPELTKIMQLIECSDAINLDGGSSSAIYLSEKLSPKSDVKQLSNPITDAILILAE